MQPQRQRQRGPGHNNRKKGRQGRTAANPHPELAQGADGSPPASGRPADPPATQCTAEHAAAVDQVQGIVRRVKASALAMSLSADAQRQQLGEGLFPLVVRAGHDQAWAAKITGMLIEDHAVMLTLLDCPAASAALGDLINQAGALLTNQAAAQLQQPRPSPPIRTKGWGLGANRRRQQARRCAIHMVHRGLA
jgi:hypothetical protein